MRRITLWLCLFCLVYNFSTPAKARDEVIYMYNWSEYMPQKVIDQFTEETGIKVVYSTYDSNESMYDMLKITSGNGYDLVVPSGYFVSMLAKEGLLRKIDKKKLKNYKNLDESLIGMNPDYAVPYCWGSTMMLVNSKYVDPETITSWNDLFKPEFADKIVMLDDLRDVFGVALYALGYSINTQNKEQIKEAYNWLKKLKPAIKAIDSEVVRYAFINEEAVIGLIYNGDVLQLNADNPELVGIYPKEGVSLWIDCLAIPKGAKNVDNAYKFINFLLRPEINKMIVEQFYYSTPNAKTFALLGEELRNNRVINPSPKELGRSEFTDYVGEALPVYEKYWSKLLDD